MIFYKNICLEFDSKMIFKNFNLEIIKGDKILLYGKSGLGKSTLIKMLLGFVYPNSGEIYYKNSKLNHNIIKKIRAEISYVSQDTNIHKSGNSIIEYINDIMNYKINRNKCLDKTKLYYLLDYFNLNNSILNKKFENVSGGERQRILLIISLILNRYIFILDEPTSNLDDKLKNKVVDYFANEPNITLICISHDKCWIDNNNISIINMENRTDVG